MPRCSEHADVSQKVLDKLCSDFEFFIDLCQLISGKNREIIEESVCDPDFFSDRVVKVTEYCICNGKEVDVETCRELERERQELEQKLSSASPEERRVIEEKLKKVPKCKKPSKKPNGKPEGYARHHGGVNVPLWRYYLYTAAKQCLKGSEESVRECMKRLARALHYAQDGPITRGIHVEGVLGSYTVRVDEIHDVYEEALADIIRYELGNLDISSHIENGVNMALNEKPFDYSRELYQAEESLAGALKAMFRFTAYTLTKFIEVIRYAKRNKERILKMYIASKVLQALGVITIAITIATLVHSPSLAEAATWSTLAGAILLMASHIMIEHIKPTLCLLKESKMCKDYIEKRILVARKREGTRTITEKHIPKL